MLATKKVSCFQTILCINLRKNRNSFTFFYSVFMFVIGFGKEKKLDKLEKENVQNLQTCKKGNV